MCGYCSDYVYCFHESGTQEIERNLKEVGRVAGFFASKANIRPGTFQ